MSGRVLLIADTDNPAVNSSLVHTPNRYPRPTFEVDAWDDTLALIRHVGQLAERTTQLIDGTAIDLDSAFEFWVQKYLEGIGDSDGDSRLNQWMGHRPAKLTRHKASSK